MPEQSDAFLIAGTRSFDRGEWHEEAGDNLAARAEFEKAAGQLEQATCGAGRSMQGQAFIRLGQHDKALGALLQAAELLEGEALCDTKFQIAMLYQLRGENQAAIHWYGLAADHGNHDALKNLYTLLPEDSPPTNVPSRVGKHLMGVMLYTGSKGMERDPARAVEMFREAAALEYGPSHQVLAMIHNACLGKEALSSEI